MELISKEVVKQIIDSGRTKEQMLGMVECAVTFESPTDSSTGEDCISRDAVLDTTICEGISCNECSFNEIDGEPGCLLHKRIGDLPSVKPKADVDALIKKIETELSWDMYDDWGNATDLHDELVDIIQEWAESKDNE